MGEALLQSMYQTEAVPALMKEFGITNRLRVPRVERIVVNTCIKEAVNDGKIVDTAANEFAVITGQRPVKTRARKSISNFKLRAGMPIGCRVTLRRRTMYDFLLKLISIALPRVRDFKGVPIRGFDGRGNYTLGLTEQGIFPEVNLDKVQQVFGMSITVVTTARTDSEGKRLLELLGVPFRKS